MLRVRFVDTEEIWDVPNESPSYHGRMTKSLYKSICSELSWILDEKYCKDHFTVARVYSDGNHILNICAGDYQEYIEDVEGNIADIVIRRKFFSLRSSDFRFDTNRLYIYAC